MAETNQEQDKSEKATPFKLKDARKKGQVAKSMELNSLLMFSVVLTVILVYGQSLIHGQISLSRMILSRAHTFVFDLNALTSWYETVVYFIANLYAPLVGAIILISILANIIQTGPVFTFFPLKPDIQRINPVAGFKRLLTVKLLFESVKSLIKLCAFSAVLYYAIIDLLPGYYRLMVVAPHYYSPIILSSTVGVLFKILVLYILIAAIDVAFVRWEFARNMRMSRKEVKDELKRREGDPLIKSRRRELQSEALKRSKALQRVPDADVLITNPTHLAIAILYKRSEMVAPIIIAKGAGELALKMREVAHMHRVPITENRVLARKLFDHVELDNYLPGEYFADIAKILIKVFADKKDNSKNS